MTTIHRLLCATDLSAASAPAWEEAKRLARLFGAEVLLTHVVPPPPPVMFPAEGYFPPDLYAELTQRAQRDAEKELDRLLGSVTGSGVTVRVRLENGSPAQRILEVVAKEAADILVVGTHGRTGLERALLGSVADRLVRQAPCPVLTVKSGPGTRTRGGIRRICYATDFSPTARAAWPWVVAIARAASAEVDLAHVTFSPVADRHLSAEALGRMAHLLHEQGHIEAERFLERSTLPRERITVHLAQGEPGEQIVRRAQEHADDLIVMGTHGWSGIVRWMLGSVAHHVIQAAPCPVLTIAPPGAASPHARVDAPAPGAGR
jgi:nucleotide-binding universal stress UspA family protein